jgi:hypothetical protein
VRSQGAQGAGFIGTHEATIANDICRDDRG